MRKLGYIFLGIFGFALVSCGPKTQKPILKSGMVNQPVQLQVSPADRQPDYMVEWTFTKLPPRVVLTKYDFQPVQTSPEVSFVPPDTGTYRLEYILRNQSGKEKVVQPFKVRVSPVSQAAQATLSGASGSGTAASRMPSAESGQSTVAGRASSPGASTTTAARTEPDRSETGVRSSSSRIDRYTVQIAALKSFSDAEAVSNQAKKLGYDSYIQRTTLPKTGEVWYRVRAGSFNTHQAAEALLKKLQQEPAFSGNNLWIDFQREDS